MLSRNAKRIEDVTCTCGAPFRRVVYSGVDGTEFTNGDLCPDCERLKQEAQAQQVRRLEVEVEDAKQREVWKQKSGIEGIFRGKTFDNFDKTKQPKAYQALHGWDGESLILAAPDIYGLGKTHLVCALANRLIEQRPAAFVHTNGSIQHAPCPVYFSTEQRLIARVLQSKPWDDDKHPERESREELYRMLVRVELLIIDDVGKVQHRDPAFTQEMYYRIIDDRYTQDRPVIITTNLSLDDLETHIGGACADRLREMCGLKGMMTMKGTSYRRVK